MNTPICDFLCRYAEGDDLRLHMPGHKGTGGIERFDITEIEGADSLYEARGIIRESEANASRLFGCPTFYSTEGSSQCIRAMLYLAVCHTGNRLILAGRNAHKTFISAAAMLGLEVEWLCGTEGSYLSCNIDARELADRLAAMPRKPSAVYLTSPDYPGNISDIPAVARVCRRYGILLIVDNAHGAYLKFLPESRHPIDLGADLCCDSAHKTLPVLTGGAYLHISPDMDTAFSNRAKGALELFGSTSPSYLILRSLDKANRYLADGYRERLGSFAVQTEKLKERLVEHGYVLKGDEPLKLTVSAGHCGYDGREFAGLLGRCGIVCEFSDPDFTVMMLTPEIGTEGLARLESAMLAVPPRTPIEKESPRFVLPERAMPIREAVFAPWEEIPVSQSEGRILALVSVGCPPAVPIAVCGERIDRAAVGCFSYYGIETCKVVCEDN